MTYVFAIGTLAVVAIPRPAILVGRSKALAVRVGLALFGVGLGVFGLLRESLPAYPMLFLVGLSYFATVTSLSTVLQSHLDENVRGRVMALWIMGFGGTVPLGLLLGGFVADRTSVTTVMLAGAAVAIILALVTNVNPQESVDGE